MQPENSSLLPKRPTNTSKSNLIPSFLHPSVTLTSPTRVPRFYRLSIRSKTLVARRTDLQAKTLLIRAVILEFRAFLDRKSAPVEAKMARIAAMWQRKVLVKLVQNVRLHRSALAMRVRLARSRR